MQIVDQSPDTFVRRELAHAVSSRHNLSVEEEAKILYDATIRGLADVAAGRKLPSEVVTTECSVDLNEAYFESPHDPREIQADEFVGTSAQRQKNPSVSASQALQNDLPIEGERGHHPVTT